MIVVWINRCANWLTREYRQAHHRLSSIQDVIYSCMLCNNRCGFLVCGNQSDVSDKWVMKTFEIHGKATTCSYAYMRNLVLHHVILYIICYSSQLGHFKNDELSTTSYTVTVKISMIMGQLRYQ